MKEIETSGARLTVVAGNDFSVNGSAKKDNIFFEAGEHKIVIGNKTFVLIEDSTHYPDPDTLMVILPKSELKIVVKPWEFIDKVKNTRTTGFKITDIELIKGIFIGNTGVNVKARNAKFSFPKKKGKIKVELTDNAIYAGGTDAELSGNFSKTPLKLTQFSEYIILGNNFYKKSLMAVKEENIADERFMAFDSFLITVLSMSSMKNLDKSADAFSQINPNEILKNFETSINRNPEILKQAGLSSEQLKQAEEMMTKFKSSGGKFDEIKKNFSKINAKDFQDISKQMKEMAKKTPDDIQKLIKQYESLPPYSKLPSKFGECEEMEEQ